MNTIPVRPGTEPEVDDETRATLEDRLKTIDRDGKASEEWTAELKDKRIRKLQTLVPK
jgi:hypothetical protein